MGGKKTSDYLSTHELSLAGHLFFTLLGEFCCVSFRCHVPIQHLHHAITMHATARFEIGGRRLNDLLTEPSHSSGSNLHGIRGCSSCNTRCSIASAIFLS